MKKKRHMLRFVLFFIMSVATSAITLFVDSKVHFEGKSYLCFLSFVVFPLLFAIGFYKTSKAAHKVTGSVLIGSSFLMVYFAWLIFTILKSAITYQG